jgi:hypothetical protein
LQESIHHALIGGELVNVGHSRLVRRTNRSRWEALTGFIEIHECHFITLGKTLVEL